MASKRVIVSGKVQGVYYRNDCRAAAVEHGVRGWVRNLPDRTVEAHFEGDSDAVERLVAWARQGPPAARVSDVRVSEAEPEGLPDFEVRPTPRGAR
ncbi:acylphosphatase [Streptomyces sp. RKND-216]|uniref:acylphosphatase n=1 Tax=Streptomyces sp. RKND-216 TaxID=2562581 RepID=UPI001B35434F|nr:acylphosphatase [Streptomyces sp. RKND-216]